LAGVKLYGVLALLISMAFLIQPGWVGAASGYTLCSAVLIRGGLVDIERARSVLVNFSANPEDYIAQHPFYNNILVLLYKPWYDNRTVIILYSRTIGGEPAAYLWIYGYGACPEPDDLKLTLDYELKMLIGLEIVKGEVVSITKLEVVVPEEEPGVLLANREPRTRPIWERRAVDAVIIEEGTELSNSSKNTTTPANYTDNWYKVYTVYTSEHATKAPTAMNIPQRSAGEAALGYAGGVQTATTQSAQPASSVYESAGGLTAVLVAFAAAVLASTALYILLRRV